MSREQMKPWLIIGLIFVAGMVSGAALAVMLQPEWQRPPGTKQIQHHWMDYLTKELNLTSVQQDQLGQILAQTGSEMKKVHADEVERVSNIFKETDARIFPLLTTEQQAKYEELEQERQRDLAHHPRRPWSHTMSPAHGVSGEGSSSDVPAPGDDGARGSR